MKIAWCLMIGHKKENKRIAVAGRLCKKDIDIVSAVTVSLARGVQRLFDRCRTLNDYLFTP